tara:strand:- start:165 stop:707 length:543 start_codon:yes stop_codon:yes gene_type:complete
MDQHNSDRPQHVHSHAALHGLSSRATGMAIVLFALIVTGMFMFAFIKKNEVETQTPAVMKNEPEQQVEYASITRVDAKRFIEKGLVTLVGEIPMPTPCDLLESGVTIAESYPEQVTLHFTVVNNADSCAQVITSQRFKIPLAVSANAVFSATFEGRSIELNIIDAAEDETPDDFELYIKG